MDRRGMVSSTNTLNYGFIKNLLPIIICLFLFNIILCPSAHARDDGRSANEMVSMMKKRLSLSPEQVAQVRPIIEDERVLRQEIMEKHDGKRRSARSEIEELQAYTESRLSNILSYEQIEEYRKLRDEVPQERRGMSDDDDDDRGGKMFKGVPGMPTF